MSLSTAAEDRKARLAALKSLKRKAPEEPSLDDDATSPSSTITTTSRPKPAKSPRTDAPSSFTQHTAEEAQQAQEAQQQQQQLSAATVLSGRNYDAATRAPKFGFEQSPATHASTTLERQAAALAASVRAQQAAEEKTHDGGDDGAAPAAPAIDLFKLQPKKPNWDLKRDLGRKLEVLGVRTDNAIAGIVRERIEGARRKKKRDAAAAVSGGVTGGATIANGQGEGGDAPEEVGMEGAALVEATHLREREDEEEARRDREEDAELDAS